MSADTGEQELKLTLSVWRQEGPSAAGHFEVHVLEVVSTHMSFLEMIDVLNE